MMTRSADVAVTEPVTWAARAARWMVWGLGTVLFLGILSPGSAHAYKRKLTRSGVEVYWKSPQVVIKVSEGCSADVKKADCLAAVQNALEVWNKPACSGFKFVFGGAVSRTDVGFDSDQPQNNVNLVTWVEAGWDRAYSGADAGSIVALTTRTFDGNSGEMLDADVTFNGQMYQFASLTSATSTTAALTTAAAQDIEGAMIHEAGHILGLDDLYDAKDKDSVMYAQRRVGEARKRALSQDDINGLCAIYPKGAVEPEVDSSGMTMASAMGCAHVQPGGAFGILGLLLILRAGRRRFGRVDSAR